MSLAIDQDMKNHVNLCQHISQVESEKIWDIKILDFSGHKMDRQNSMHSPDQ